MRCVDGCCRHCDRLEWKRESPRKRGSCTSPAQNVYSSVRVISARADEVETLAAVKRKGTSITLGRVTCVSSDRRLHFANFNLSLISVAFAWREQ